MSNYICPYSCPLTLPDLWNIVFGLAQIFIPQSKVANEPNVVVVSDFASSIVSYPIRTSNSQVFDTTQKIIVGNHVPILENQKSVQGIL